VQISPHESERKPAIDRHLLDLIEQLQVAELDLEQELYDLHDMHAVAHCAAKAIRPARIYLLDLRYAEHRRHG
jgi:hypothetical protein